MDLITLDWETYYADDYTLSKMTTEAYVRDPRFETILCSVKINATKTFWLLPDRLKVFLDEEVDWANTAVIAHHAHFDGAILNWHYNHRPAMWIDTLSMARVIHGAKAGNSLAALLIRHGLIEKGNYVTFAKNKHLADFTGGELQEYGKYSCGDSDGTYDLAQIMLPQLPEHELRLIDLTIRMFTEPVLVGDQPKLKAAGDAERARKIELLQRIGLHCDACGGEGRLPDLLSAGLALCKKCGGLGVNKKPIGSNDQFAELLRKAGVEPETKTSPATGKQIYAFAKTDSHMQELQEHPDEEVRVLADARIGVKSNIIETRSQRFLDCARRGPMPVYISHAGAHTLRPSGGDSMNWLNMSSHNENRPEMGVLKESIQAPPGHVVMEVDSGQGEARILAYLANQMDLLEAFAQNRDIYSEYASGIYRRPVNRKKVKADHIPGQLGKISVLQLGFGAGWYTLALGLLKGLLGNPPIQLTEEHMLAMSIDPQPFLANPKKIQIVSTMPTRLELNDMLIHCIVAESLVKGYREKYKFITGNETYFKHTAISGFWRTCELAINAMIAGTEMRFGAEVPTGSAGLFRTEKDRVLGPTGLWMDYRDIKRDENGEATYFNGRNRTKIYGSLFCENLVQNFHRLVVSEQMLDIAEVLKVVLWPYDAVATVAPAEAADQALEFMIQTMAAPRTWAPGLPLMAEGGYGPTLASAKPK